MGRGGGGSEGSNQGSVRAGQTRTRITEGTHVRGGRERRRGLRRDGRKSGGHARESSGGADGRGKDSEAELHSGGGVVGPELGRVAK